jgi:hypothetical protein
MIRHDIDRWPSKALRMAKLENEMGIQSSYYFRTKPHVCKPGIIRSIRRLGHEIGYHYETLSDVGGDVEAAVKRFQHYLGILRLNAPVKTISMHGRPLSRYNNLDLWRNPEIRSGLFAKFGLLGEVYLDIDYEDIAYISDTGRNWKQSQSNKRDVVESSINVSLENGFELLTMLKQKRWQKIVFQIHPERWSENGVEHCVQLMKDKCANLAKRLL